MLFLTSETIDHIFALLRSSLKKPFQTGALFDEVDLKVRVLGECWDGGRGSLFGPEHAPFVPVWTEADTHVLEKREGRRGKEREGDE